MSAMRRNERGEGKIGCIVSLLVLIIVGGVAAKVVPVLYANNSLVNAAEDLGSRAGVIPAATLEQQLRAKAAELEIPEALVKGGITLTILGDRSAGTCVIKLKYTQKLDLYGAYTLPITTDKTISRPYMDAR
ncbi:hypothetical protein [Mesoterricola silvestris]|uniref:DUF4845 domain-containing protein n=1 Tax=Mesoterricola silvestris TaxID=2927979 RepID=A0AA48GJR9_9BACT|nr:hypothetical protein [Mesoterricola silvestris]BDU71024.1 hypothetical protein METEAL_01980 [Mesoterricola silvestris]